MRHLSIISEEIRALDVAQGAIDTEQFGLVARDNLTDGESTRLKQLNRATEKNVKAKADLEHEHRQAQADRAEQVEEIRVAARNPKATERGADLGGPALVSGRAASDRQLWGSDPTFRGQSHTELANRATAILERAGDFGPVDPDAIDRIGALVEKNEGQSYAARFVAASSDPEYLRALEKVKFGANDADGRLRWTDSETTAYLRAEEFRAAMSTGGTAAYLIPFSLDPSVILTNAGAANPFRQISRVVTTATNPWHGVSSAGVSAEWTSEAAEVTDASPTFVQPTVTAVRFDAHIQASIEVNADTNIGNQIGVLFADAKNNLEAAAFATGTGSTQPWGIVTRLASTTASRVASNTNAAFGSVDLFAMVNALPARAQGNASWVGHWGIANLVRQFTASSSPQAGNFWTDLGGGTPPELLGAPFYRSSSMTSTLSAATASTDSVLVLGDFTEFLIVDALGSQVAFNPIVLGPNRRPTGEVSWTLFGRTGADVLDTGQFRLLQV